MLFRCKSCGNQTEASTPNSSVLFSTDSRAGAHRRRLEDLEVQILRFQAQIDALRGERAELKEKLAGIVFPILTLPNEITSEIFVQCLPANGRVRPSEDVAPLSLMKVCRHFRQVAVATPIMWTSLTLDLRHGWERTTLRTIGFETGLANLVEEWFSRAGSQPLSITLKSGKSISPIIFHTLASFSSQWHRLEIDSLPKDVAFLEEICGDLPSLRQLGLTSALTAGDGFLSAPKLSEARLRSMGGLLEPSVTAHSLTSLRIDEFDLKLSQFLDILEGYPRLLNLDCIVPFYRGDEPRSTPLPVYRLISLTLRCDCDALSFVSLPELQQLKTFADDPLESKAFAIWSQMASCSLRHLTLWWIGDWLWDEVMETLKAFPTLTSLEISMKMDGSDTCEEEYIWEPKFTALESADLLPNLTTLKIVEPRPRSSLYAIVRILTERRKHNSRLVNVELEPVEDAKKDDYRIRTIQLEFADLIAGGLNFRIIPPNTDQEDVYFP
ncbi:hypothetical protein C8R43DRAFT_504812 [Mycena crocata]|nr:hypothetical protein C8R43DRAFT_504812 [Mycena crocata]